jgi:hypothetical protein
LESVLFHSFNVEDTVPLASLQIQKYEYVIDSSLHKTSLVGINTFNPSVDSINQTYSAHVDTGLSLLNNHYFRLWIQNGTGLTSTWHKDTFVVIDCPMLDTSVFKTSGNFCIGETVSFQQDITKFGIWPKDSFDFTWYINDCCTTFSTQDSFSTSFSSTGQVDVRFIYQKKSESRCRGEITQSFTVGSQYNDTIQKFVCDNDSLKIHGIFRKRQWYSILLEPFPFMAAIAYFCCSTKFKQNLQYQLSNAKYAMEIRALYLDLGKELLAFTPAN